MVGGVWGWVQAEAAHPTPDTGALVAATRLGTSRNENERITPRYGWVLVTRDMDDKDAGTARSTP